MAHGAGMLGKRKKTVLPVLSLQQELQRIRRSFPSPRPMTVQWESSSVVVTGAGYEPEPVASMGRTRVVPGFIMLQDQSLARGHFSNLL